jgi:hypothetical protein
VAATQLLARRDQLTTSCCLLASSCKLKQDQRYSDELLPATLRGAPMKRARLLVADLAAAALATTVLHAQPVQAGKVSRTLGIIGGVAVGAVILNEAAKARRAEQPRRQTVRQSAPPQQKDASAKKGETSTAEAGGEASIVKDANAPGAAPGDPFAGVPSSRQAKTGD